MLYTCNSDSYLVKQKRGWAPKESLKEGLKKTYPWIAEQVKKLRH